VLIRLYCFCSDNEISLVEVSRSDFHNGQDEEAIQKLKCLSFSGERKNMDYKNLIHEGKAKELNYWNGTIDTARKITPDKELIIEGEETISNELYINCNGDVCLDCNLSYQRQVYNNIGNIKEKPLMEMNKKEMVYA